MLTGLRNTYAYVGGNPVSRIDPLGLCDDDKQKCIQSYLKNNYGDFVANSLVPSFALQSYVPGSPNFSSAVGSIPEAAVVKGGIAVAGFGGAAGLYLSMTGNVTAERVALALAKGTGAAVEFVPVIAGGLTSFSTTAEFIAWLNCQ